jgi:hypothetical protein
MHRFSLLTSDILDYGYDAVARNCSNYLLPHSCHVLKELSGVAKPGAERIATNRHRLQQRQTVSFRAVANRRFFTLKQSLFLTTDGGGELTVTVFLK